MGELGGLVGDLVGILAALGGAYFFVGFVANLVQAQVSTVTGDSIGRARAVQQGLGMVLLLCIAVSVRPLTAGLISHFYGSGYSAAEVLESEGGVYALWTELANLVAYIIVGGGVAVMTAGAVYAGLGLQVARLIGLPIGIGRAFGNLLAVLMGLALTVGAASLSRGLINIIFSFAR
jgi:threonine/homoserine efflux transporter RhtA